MVQRDSLIKIPTTPPWPSQFGASGDDYTRPGLWIIILGDTQTRNDTKSGADSNFRNPLGNAVTMGGLLNGGDRVDR